MSSMKISFCIVAYHEQDLIRRCLDSIKDVADEILVVHDGPCEDQTLDIVREYTQDVFIGERQKGSDPHRVLLFEKARNQWVFMIDADEYLSDELKTLLLDPMFSLDGFAGMAVKWPLWNGERYVTQHNWRTVLFDKEKCWAIGLHNFPTHVVGPVKRIPVILEHKPRDTKIGLRRILSAGISKRVVRDAHQYLLGYDALKKYNEHLIPESFKEWLNSYTAHPGRYMLWNPIKHFIGALRHSYKDGWYGFVSALQLAIFQFRLARAMMKIKKGKL